MEKDQKGRAQSENKKRERESEKRVKERMTGSDRRVVSRFSGGQSRRWRAVDQKGDEELKAEDGADGGRECGRVQN